MGVLVTYATVLRNLDFEFTLRENKTILCNGRPLYFTRVDPVRAMIRTKLRDAGYNVDDNSEWGYWKSAIEWMAKEKL